MSYISLFTQNSYYCDFFCLGASSHLRERHCSGLVSYWYYKNYGLMFVWYSSFFTPYSYYHEIFCLGPALCLHNCHFHVWVRFNDNTKITVACMSLLLLSTDIQRYWYFIMFYLNWTVVQWRNGGWLNGVMVK